MCAVTTSESRWTELDRAEALAWSMYRGSLCPGGCGHPLAESTSHWETGPQYDAKKVNCRACAAREEAKRAIPQPTAGTVAPDEGSRLWYVHKIEG